MAAVHWLKVELDEENNTVTGRHFAAAPFGPDEAKRDVTVWVDVAIPAELADQFRALLTKAAELNRKSLDVAARKAAALHNHVSELNGEFDGK